jgi:hypothetical protein
VFVEHLICIYYSYGNSHTCTRDRLLSCDIPNVLKSILRADKQDDNLLLQALNYGTQSQSMMNDLAYLESEMMMWKEIKEPGSYA